LLTSLRDGDLCERCRRRGVEHQMFRALITWRNGKPTSRFLDVDDFPGRAFGGPQTKLLSYRSCNRSAGAKLGNRMRAMAKLAAAGGPEPKYNRW
jgi:hypothetical protein